MPQVSQVTSLSPGACVAVHLCIFAAISVSYKVSSKTQPYRKRPNLPRRCLGLAANIRICSCMKSHSPVPWCGFGILCLIVLVSWQFLCSCLLFRFSLPDWQLICASGCSYALKLLSHCRFLLHFFLARGCVPGSCWYGAAGSCFGLPFQLC